MFWDYFYTFESVDDLLWVYANGRAIKQLSQPIGRPQHAWLDIFDTFLLQNKTEIDYDDGDGVPQMVDGTHDIESDDAAL